MSRCRHDVLFFDSERSRVKRAAPVFGAVCEARFASNVNELHEELTNTRPDLFVYAYNWTDNSQLEKIGQELSQPEFVYLPIVIIMPVDQQELVIKNFENLRITVQPALELDENGALKLKSVLDELDLLPHVAVVDDDDISRSVIVHMLEDYCNISEFGRGDDFLKFLDNNKPDVVLLDVNMPGLSGFDTIDRIREVPGMKKLPIIMLTGDSDRDTVLTSVTKKTSGYLVKPVDREELRNRIRQVLEAGTPKPKIRTVMVVDDDINTLKTVQAILKGECKVVAIADTDQAEQYVADQVPDMILLDYEMPGHNGLYLLQKLRIDERFNNCPIVMLTGNKDRQTVMSCFASGAQGYLTKPVNALSLRLRVRQHLSEAAEFTDD